MTLCISISLSAYVTLFCLFSPKLYIIVFQVYIINLKPETHMHVQPTAGLGHAGYPMGNFLPYLFSLFFSPRKTSEN